MLRITAMSADGWKYLARGADCQQQELPVERERTDAAGYYLSATEHGEAPGIWRGTGLGLVGIEDGTAVTEDDLRAVFGELKHPETGEQLGRRPKRFKTLEERIAAAQAKEPEATAERLTEIANAEALATKFKAVAFYDFTFSPQKSVSVLHAALLAAGDTEGAAKVRAAHDVAIGSAMARVEQDGLMTRTGYHGKSIDGGSVGKHERIDGAVYAAFQHSTNREDEPQLHTHVGLLNRGVTASDGKTRALDGNAFKGIKEAADAEYQRALEQTLCETLGVQFVERPDGKAREIAGIAQELLNAGSTRARQVEADVDRRVAEFEECQGHAPSPKQRAEMRQKAALETRGLKSTESGPVEKQLSWAAANMSSPIAVVDGALSAAEQIGREGHPDKTESFAVHREAVLSRAVDAAQSEYSSWSRGNLEKHLTRELSRVGGGDGESVRELAGEILAAPERFGVVTVSVSSLVEVPAALQREDGVSIYRPVNAEKYATQGQLDTESRIVAVAQGAGKADMPTEDLDLLRVELAANGLDEKQLEAVAGVLGSSRHAEVLIGPAGTGKSKTVGTLAQVWQGRLGGRVIGLATSQIATENLIGEGLEAVNTSRFLQETTRNANGVVVREILPGDLYVIDEAGMSSTAELDKISALLAESGARVLYTGDPEQLVSVGAGGMLRLLDAELGSYQLEEVHRLRNEWEQQASLRMREGDTSVVTEYETHGRLHGGTLEDIEDQAVRGWLADTLDGRESLLLTATNEQAQRLGGTIRRELQILGRVEETNIGTLRDGNAYGVGDMIQARKNNWEIDADRMVTNRATYTVRGVDDRGRVIAEHSDGTMAYLPVDYMNSHVTLAYASTTHAAQGRSVDTTHGLLDETSSRNNAYTEATRGRYENHLYVPTARQGDEHGESVETTPHAALTSILGNAERERTATEMQRQGVDAAGSLSVIGTEWDLLTTEYARDRYTDVLAAKFAPAELDALTDAPGFDRLCRSVREAEMAGHNVETLLGEAVDNRSLADANSVSDVLRFRVRQAADRRTPEQTVDPRDWTTLSAPLGGPIGQYAHELAVLASDRQHELGRTAAEEPPTWALERLGPVPEVDSPDRDEWIRRAGVAGAYRELHAIPDDARSIGAAPSREQTFHRALWAQAAAALGQPTDALDYRAASDAELRDHVDRWRREQSWAPHYVAEDLRTARELADEHRRDAILGRTEIDASANTDPQWRELAEAEVARAERLAALYTERAEQLDEIHQARGRWHESTELSRTAADEAAGELKRRDVPIDLVDQTPQPVQTELFEIDTHRPEPAAEKQLALDVDPTPAPDAREQAQDEDVQQGRDSRDESRGPVDQVAEIAERHTRTEREPVEPVAADVEVDPAAPVDDPNQTELFELPDSAVVAQQPVKKETVVDNHVRDELTDTLAEARRQAQRADQRRIERAAADEARRKAEAAERERAREEAARARRDEVERERAATQQEQQRDKERAREQQIDDGPSLERTPQERSSATAIQNALRQHRGPAPEPYRPPPQQRDTGFER